VWSRPSGRDETLTGFEFHPWRFNDLSRADYRHALVEYGCGARQCIGLNFANLTMKLFLSDICTAYRLKTDKSIWELGMRRNKSIMTPNPHTIHFERVE
jgi:cytochrome P450